MEFNEIFFLNEFIYAFVLYMSVWHKYCGQYEIVTNGVYNKIDFTKTIFVVYIIYI